MTLVDTGPLVAALDRRESNHRWATGIFERLREPLWTCGAVLSETTRHGICAHGESCAGE